MRIIIWKVCKTDQHFVRGIRFEKTNKITKLVTITSVYWLRLSHFIDYNKVKWYCAISKYTKTSQKFCNISISAGFWIKCQELKKKKKKKKKNRTAYSQGPNSLRLLLVWIHSLLLVLMTLQQPRGGGSFRGRVLHVERQELVSVWD